MLEVRALPPELWGRLNKRAPGRSSPVSRLNRCIADSKTLVLWAELTRLGTSEGQKAKRAKR